MAKKKIVYLNTKEELSMDEYIEYLHNCDYKENEIEYLSTEEQYYSFLADKREEDFYEFLNNIEYLTEKYTAFFMKGTIRAWDGKHDIQPYAFTNIKDAIYKSLTSANDYKIEYCKGEIIVHGYHHDGMNLFTIVPLSASGLERLLPEIKNGEVIWGLRYYDSKRFEEEYLF